MTTFGYSNIATHLTETDSIQKTVNNAIASLNKNKKLLISYLYKTSFYQSYQENWTPIYDFENKKYLFPGLEIENSFYYKYKNDFYVMMQF